MCDNFKLFLACTSNCVSICDGQFKCVLNCISNLVSVCIVKFKMNISINCKSYVQKLKKVIIKIENSYLWAQELVRHNN